MCFPRRRLIHFIHVIWLVYIWWIFHVELEKEQSICSFHLKFDWHLSFTDKHCHAHAYLLHKKTDAHSHDNFFRFDNWCLWGAAWPAGAGERGYGGEIWHSLSSMHTRLNTHKRTTDLSIQTIRVNFVWYCKVYNTVSDLDTKTIEQYLKSVVI